MPSRAGFLAAWLLPVALFVAAARGGLWPLLVPAYVFGVMPLLDLLVGSDPRNPGEEEARAAEAAWWFRAILYGYAVLHFVLLGYGTGHAATLSGAELAAFTLATGIVTGGIGITVAHELGHRRHWLEWGLARALLVTVGYLHFHVEHNQGHHARVATPHDPATARLGEGFWSFLPRTVVGSWRSAWHIEVRRLAGRGLPAWHPRNAVLWGGLASLALAALAYRTGGPAALLWAVGQALVAITLLELVNYIEHYGLARAEEGDGRYAKVSVHHSWNASERVSNWFLFNLQRHSHHHAHSGKRYPALLHFAESPQLPTGYPGMVLLALVTPLWRRVMDPRTLAYHAAHPEAAGRRNAA